MTGKPALYQTQSGTTSTATLSGISVVNLSGSPVTGYSFVGADAKSTDTGESITRTSDKPLSLISTIGNACNSGALLTGVGTTTVKCPATVSSDQDGHGHPGRREPDVVADFVGQGLQAVAFGVLVSTVQVNKTVAGRINPSDAFAVQVASSTGSVLGSANTGTAATASTGQVTVLTSSAGGRKSYTLSRVGHLRAAVGLPGRRGRAPVTAPPIRPCRRGRRARRRRDPRYRRLRQLHRD